MTDCVAVCDAGDLAPGDREVVSVGGVSIGVFNVDGEYHALSNTCPHQNGPVCEGEILRDVAGDHSEPGDRVTGTLTDDRVVVCPWHGWTFEVATGEHAGAEDVQLAAYDVTVEDGVVYVEG